MSRQRRLASARSWLEKFSGKHLFRGYCKHFGVDWRCAAVELAILGVKIDPAYLAARELTEAEISRRRAERKRQKEAESIADSHSDSDPFPGYGAEGFMAVYGEDFAVFDELQQPLPAEATALTKVNSPAPDWTSTDERSPSFSRLPFSETERPPSADPFQPADR